eukprot:7069561-Prorocentrum_lima.AAC.1
MPPTANQHLLPDCRLPLRSSACSCTSWPQRSSGRTCRSAAAIATHQRRTVCFAPLSTRPRTADWR